MRVIRDSEILQSYNRDALGYSGNPEGLFRPESVSEVVEIVKWANREKKFLTPTALRSSTTGSCVAERGYLISSEKFTKLLDIDRKRKVVKVEPGFNLGELKKILEEEGLFFPPDPTSENECSVGGCVATNASGARTFKYGPFRKWVEGIEIVLPKGDVISIGRKVSEKNCAGYFGFQNPIDFFIGSEGTLGFITGVYLKVMDKALPFYALFVPFESERDAISFCINVKRNNLPVRCLEYFDRKCVELLKENRSDFKMRGNCFIFMEFEFEEGKEVENLDFWLSYFEKNRVLVEEIIVADTEKRKCELKEMRHFIPSTLNEISYNFINEGGGKVSTDWAVYIEDLYDTMVYFRELCKNSGIGDIYCFGHVGNGHPHFNFILKNSEEKKMALEVVDRISSYVCKKGGTITAEHGIGKVKKRYLKFYYNPIFFSWMRGFKEMIDPNLIFSPGNIFDFEDFKRIQ